MATPVSDLRLLLQREINVPGFPQLPDVTTTELDGYIADGFWEARLLGMLEDYTIVAGEIGHVTDQSDLPAHYQMMVVIVAGLKMIRLKALNLAMSFSAKAGPVEYEQQVSATVLRAILESLERRLQALKGAYSDLWGGGTFIYFDGELQREASILSGLRELSVIP